MVWTYLVPALELVALFAAALLNQEVTRRFARLRRFELLTLILLWYLVLLGGALLGGISAPSEG